tara:strand:- start:1163 stop:1696 length:534 start_codon:yes stop_codon:yes gene_type:complete
MFDGGVDYCTGYVGLTTRSKNLFQDVSQLLTELNQIPDYTSASADKFQRWKILFRKNEKLHQCTNLFEKDSEKWHRLREHLYGLHHSSNDLELVYKQFNHHYPKTRKSSITFTDIIKVVEELRLANVNDISKKLKKGSTTAYTYLEKLTKWNVLRSKRIGLQKHWELHENMSFPRRK